MVATTMPSIPLLLAKLQDDFSSITFVSQNTFSWNPTTGTVTYFDEGPVYRLLHEVGHATLGHRHYRRDIDLLGMERDAWQAALQLATRYHIRLNVADIEDDLDSYRNWLHARSTCPSCQANGIQITSNRYRCIECETVWKVNEARYCQLRRTIITSY